MNSKEINKANGIKTINYANLHEVITKDQRDKERRIQNSKINNQKETQRRKLLRAKNKEEDRIEGERIKFIEPNYETIHSSITLTQ